MEHASLLAQRICIPAAGNTPDCFDGPIPTGTFSLIGNFTISDVVNRAVIFVFPIAGIILFIMLVLGGFSFLTSGGDPKKMEGAKNMITMSLVGFAILLLAYWITQIVAFVFGLKTGVI